MNNKHGNFRTIHEYFLLDKVNGQFKSHRETLWYFTSDDFQLMSLTNKIDRGSVNLTSILSVMFETFSLIYSHITSSVFFLKLLAVTLGPIATLYGLSKDWSGAQFLEKVWNIKCQ